jgi:hypothetical protein
MKHKCSQIVSTILVAAALIACSQEESPPWSKVIPWKDGSKSIGTPGLALLRGASKQIEFELGPRAYFIAPVTAETQNDGELVGDAVGTWILEKGNTKISLPVRPDGRVKTYGYYDNIDSEIWSVLSSAGCATLTASVESGFSGSSSVIQRRYRLCGVSEAAKRLTNGA